MNRKERLRVVREALASVWDSQGHRFVTFEAGEGDETPWVQYIDGVLHLEWTGEEDPAAALPRIGIALPTGAFVASHAPGTSAQIAVGDVLLDDVAGLVLALCEDLLAGGARNLEIRSRVEVA